MGEPDDGTEDFDERCTGVESCECAECCADDIDLTVIYCQGCGASPGDPSHRYCPPRCPVQSQPDPSRPTAYFPHPE